MTAIKVANLPVDPGPAAWNAVLPPQGPAREVTGDHSADWIIIGAGFAGLSAARRLSQLRPDDRVVVIEARRVAQGPAGRNSGFMIDLPHDLSSSDYGGVLDKDLLLTSDNRYAIDFAQDMATEFGLGPEVFDRSGKINAAATSKGDEHNRDYARHLAAMGEPSEMLDADAMRAMTGTDYYRSGLYTSGAAIIQPAAFIRGIARGLVQKQIEIYENSPVVGLARSNVWTARCPNGTVTAPKVILAVNGHLNSFGFYKNQLMHVFTYASMTAPLTPEQAAKLGGHPHWGVTPADPLGTTIRKIISPQGVRIVVRNRFTFDPSMQVDQARINRVARDHDTAFAARFPMLNDVGMQYRWGGRLCLSRNNVSVVQEVDTDLFSACCQNGLGTTRGTLSGMFAAELATQTHSPRLERAMSAAQPQKLPPKWIAQIGATAFLKWNEKKAGAEL